LFAVDDASLEGLCRGGVWRRLGVMDAAVADADTIAAADPPPTRVQPLLSTASGASGSEALVLAYVLLALPLCPHLRACIGRTRIAGSMPCFAEWWICCAGTALWQPMTSARRLSLGFSGLVCHRSSACASGEMDRNRFVFTDGSMGAVLAMHAVATKRGASVGAAPTLLSALPSSRSRSRSSPSSRRPRSRPRRSETPRRGPRRSGCTCR
jgi:hypothetical protein